MSVKLTNRSKLYGNSEVLHNVSFKVRPGEIVTFPGPNGTGKSTCIKLQESLEFSND